MEPALSLQRTKFNQLIQWFTGCEKHPDELFTALASGLGITPRALIQILIVTYKKRDHNLESYLLNEELSMAQQHQYAQTINQLLAPGSLLHGVTHYLDPDKWMCFMQTLHDVVHDPDPLFRPNTGKYYECVSRVSEETPIPRNIYAYGQPTNLDNIGLGIPQLPTTKSPKDVAITDIKEGILKILNGDRKFLFHTLKTKIIEYLKNKTIDNNDVFDLYNEYNTMFYRTNERREDETMDQSRSRSKIIRQESIMKALFELSSFMVGGKRSRLRSKKRGRKSVHRRKKSMHKKRK
jgi:hypothetical protein